MQPYIHESARRIAAPIDALPGLIGGKAASLSIMAGTLGLPVPPAITAGIAAFHRWRSDGSLDFLEPELVAGLEMMQRQLDRRFGAPTRPLIVSVRSGAPVSMPGMMDTVLNLGLNDDTAAGLALELGTEAAARALSQFRKSFLHIVGVPAPDDVWQQLRLAIGAVFRSWDSPRAQTYRARAGLSDSLGTAATVQAMVFGTAPGISGTGVAFTRDPSTGDPRAVGDWLRDAQGEDVVAGTHATQPLAALADVAPAQWAELTAAFRTLEAHYQDMCDIEFTIEAGRLWILQARVGKRSTLAAVRIAVDRAEDPNFRLTWEQALAAVSPADLGAMLAERHAASGTACLATGLGASPGLATGKACFDADDALDRAAAGEDVILVRPETSPEDIHGMNAATGIITATGGLVSHAAIVAREWHKPAVVGAAAVVVGAASAMIGHVRIGPDDTLTIDGSTGRIFAGLIDSDRIEMNPAVSRFIARAIAAGDGTIDPVAALASAQSKLLVLGDPA